MGCAVQPGSTTVVAVASRMRAGPAITSLRAQPFAVVDGSIVRPRRPLQSSARSMAVGGPSLAARGRAATAFARDGWRLDHKRLSITSGRPGVAKAKALTVRLVKTQARMAAGLGESGWREGGVRAPHSAGRRGSSASAARPLLDRGGKLAQRRLGEPREARPPPQRGPASF